MLAQSANVFDRDENPVSLSVIELEVLCGRPIARLHQLGARVSTDPVGRVYNQFAEMKWRGELCGQPCKCTPLLPSSNQQNHLFHSHPQACKLLAGWYPRRSRPALVVATELALS